MGQQGAQATRTAASGVDQLTGKVKSLLATLGGFAAIRGALNLSDELSMAQTRINNITGDLAETAIVQRQIYEAAQRSRGSYQEMMNTVAGLKAQTGDTFGSIQEAAGFVELLQKQFKLAGTDATGISSTMYNLTQALSTGTLKGQDLNTVFANAPQLVQRIADYMGQPIGKIKDLASEGKITADIVKGAIIGAADDINAQFDAMPMTFGDAVQKVRNVGIRAFQPLGQMIADAVNSPRFDAAVQSMTRGIQIAAEIGSRGFEMLGGAVDFVASHLEVLGPIIGGLTAGAVKE
jgi:tape measure domain-containing protein